MSRMVGNVKHDGRCACPVCDPDQTKLKAARERAEAEKAARIAAGALPASRPLVVDKPQPRTRWRPPSDDTRRLAELLRAGKTFTQAAEIIEAEKHQPRQGDPT